jgi:hypothetical protein
MKDQKVEEIDGDLVIEFVNGLIKEHKNFSQEDFSSSMNKNQAIWATHVTCKRLAQESGKKFYYECIRYIMEIPYE